MEKYEVTVQVFTKAAVLNPEDLTIKRALESLKFVLEKISKGSCFVIGIHANSETEALEVATQMSIKLLANHVTEQHKIVKVVKVVEAPAAAQSAAQPA